MRSRRRGPDLPLPPGLVVLAVALAGLGALAIAHAVTAPVPVSVADLARVEGARVALDARVVSAHARVLALADATGRVTAFPPRHAPLLGPGDDVHAVGTVARDASGFVLSLERVHVTARAAERVLSVADLADAPARYEGTPVRVLGVLAREKGVGWTLSDAWSGERVRLQVERVPEAWVEDAALRVDGRFDFHERALAYRVVVDAWSWA